ncbi:hypothetical protein BY458DRAFT_515082 [Sporodiniella umbellata]|nr:hypothetical protein BY458DRAFT_515082 [Sporodiniella umbellata]
MADVIAFYALDGIFKVITHIFFREVKTSDAHLVPTTGPCIFIVGPHANQFVDGVVFLSNNPRTSYALMADVSYKKPLIGHVGKLLNSIPVVRPQDVSTQGIGKIRYDPDTTPYEIQGIDTHFCRQLQPKDSIFFGNSHKVHVDQILSDTRLTIQFGIQLAKEEKGRWFEYKSSPYINQTAVYQETYRYLNQGECVTLFPEGGSHDRSEMLPLKAGFAVMALGAAAENPTLDIKIVPVGMNYFHPDKFRSRAVVSFGQPIPITPEQVECYKRGGQEKQSAIAQLLTQSDEAFKAITFNAPDYDTLMLIQAARRLYSNKRSHIEQAVKLNRHFASLWTQFRGNPDLEVMVKKLKYYNDLLRFFGIRDHQVERLNIRPSKAIFQCVKRTTKLVVLALLQMPILISNLPLIWITNYISKIKQKQALAGSSVKISGKDVIASWKVIVVSVAAPALYGFYAMLYWLYLIRRRPFLTHLQKIQRAICVWAIQPILTYLLMHSGDTGTDIYKSIQPLFLAIRNPEAGEILRQMRKDLSKDITDFVNRHAPELGLDLSPLSDQNTSHEDLFGSALISQSQVSTGSTPTEFLNLDSSLSSSNFEVSSIEFDEN